MHISSSSLWTLDGNYCIYIRCFAFYILFLWKQFLDCEWTFQSTRDCLQQPAQLQHWDSYCFLLLCSSEKGISKKVLRTLCTTVPTRLEKLENVTTFCCYLYQWLCGLDLWLGCDLFQCSESRAAGYLTLQIYFAKFYVSSSRNGFCNTFRSCLEPVAHARPVSVPVAPPSLTDIPIVHSWASSSSKSLHTAPLNNLTVTRVSAGDNWGFFSFGRDLFSTNNLNKMDDDQAKTL